MNFEKLIGETLISINVIGDEEIIFEAESGKIYKMFHGQDCCESVYVEDVNGEIEDVIGHKIVAAYEAESENLSIDELEMWTFYHIRTLNGDICIRWNGSSNGYYSVSVEFTEV